MKYLASPEFSVKLRALSEVLRPYVGNVIHIIDTAIDQAALLSDPSITDMATQDGLFVLRSGPVRVFIALAGTGVGEDAYVVLLDVVTHASGPANTTASKDPRYDHSTNPTYTHAINPTYTHAINPIYNHAINPTYNHIINPLYNHTINPTYNHTINPVYNHAINPTYNHTIHPRYNHSINPRYNQAFSGPYIYDLGGNREGFVVRANEQVDVQFDNSLAFIGFMVRHKQGVGVLFDASGLWTGYLVPHQAGFARFTRDGKWTGYVVT